MKPPAQEIEQSMKTKQATQTGQPRIARQTPDQQRRINACWLRLWKAVYPNTPPPTEVRNSKSKVQGLKSKAQTLQTAAQTQDFRRQTQDSARSRPAAA